MTRLAFIAAGWLALAPTLASSQEVVVSGFPIGVGSSVSQDFFKPFYPELQAVADSLHKYTLAWAIITGGADGIRYRINNDAMNPALALGRAHALRNLLINEFDIDSMRIAIRSEDVEAKDARYRHATVRVAMGYSNLHARLEAVEKLPPVEKHFMEVTEVTNILPENIGLELSAGLSSSPYGAIPILDFGLQWKNFLFIEGLFGHTFWNSTFRFEDTDLDTKRRLAGGQIVVYPWKDKPVGIVAGWIRIEEISRKFYKYVRMSEGPMFGFRASPYPFLSVTGVYNPSRRRVSTDNLSVSKNGQFMISMTYHMTFGGEK